MTNPPRSTLSTVSSRFIDDWLAALQALCPPQRLASLLERSGLTGDHTGAGGRVTLDQIVRLYQIAAVETGDEMMGLWSRPIRQRALQHLLSSVREATSLPSALYRFSTFWNLLLDDYRFDLTENGHDLILTLHPQDNAVVRPFGHMLILKLAHGLMSWLAGGEVPVKMVGFAFTRPAFDQDYATVFPAPVDFSRSATFITFDPRLFGAVLSRNTSDVDHFLQNAPRDWLFTRSREHTQSLRVRTILGRADWAHATLTETAQAMNMTPRTLIRRLDADGTSFQAIKDALRRDIAIRDLQAGRKSIEAIAHDVGFSSAANFHRAFQRWTGSPPSAYRSPVEGKGACVTF